eukprot:3546340-Amphidinium_carterae.2
MFHKGSSRLRTGPYEYPASSLSPCVEISAPLPLVQQMPHRAKRPKVTGEPFNEARASAASWGGIEGWLPPPLRPILYWISWLMACSATSFTKWGDGQCRGGYGEHYCLQGGVQLIV